MDWTAMDWTAMGWVAMDWTAMDWTTIGWVAMDWVAMDWTAMGDRQGALENRNFWGCGIGSGAVRGDSAPGAGGIGSISGGYYCD